MIRVRGFPNYYLTSWGTIYSNISNKFLTPCINSGGYYLVVLVKNKKHYSRFIHTLVLEAYRGKRPKGMCCRHLNGNKLDNKISNLRWGTYKENSGDEIRLGKSKRGDKNGMAKLKEQDVRYIIYLWRTKLFKYKEIAAIYNISIGCLKSILSKHNWKHIWKELRNE